MSTAASAQPPALVDADQAIRLIADAHSCVVLVGPKISQDLGLGSALDEPAIKAANAQISGVGAEARNEVYAAISSYCGRLLTASGSPVRDMIAALAAEHRLAHIYTEDAHTVTLVPASASSEQVSDIESRSICIHGRITHFTCKVCTAKSQLTQAVLLKAMTDKPIACDVCCAQGALADSSNSADATFIPDVLCARENEQLALELAQSDAAAPIDLLLVVGASEGASTSWSATASVLSLAATQTLVVGQTDMVPAGIVSDGKTSVVCESVAEFVQQYLSHNLAAESDAALSAVPSVADLSLAEVSSAAESGDDRTSHSGRTALGAANGNGQSQGSRRAKTRNREKANLNHLLNFSLPVRAPPPVVRPRRRGAEGPVSERQAQINRSLFINANFRFVLKPQFWQSFMAVASRPDMQLRPDWIERVIMPVSGESTNCPICLAPPVAARVTRCGHVFCLPCILRHLSYNSGDDTRQDKGCPICWCTISADTLLPIHFWAAQYDTSTASKSVESNVPTHSGKSKLAPGTHITLQLMKRLRGTTICLPRSSSARIYTPALIDGIKRAEDGSRAVTFDSSHFPWTFSDGALPYARFMMAAHAYAVSEYDRELCELRQSKDDQGTDSEARLFMESAIMTIEASLAEAQTPGKTEAKLEALAFAEQGAPAAPGAQPVGEHRSGDDNVDEDFLYLYQADDGQHIYMHPLHMRVLAHDYGGFAKVPDTLEIKLRRSVESMITDEVRKRFRFLDHLPLRCELVIVEPELKHLVSHASLDKFRQQLSHHDKQHLARERRAELEEARAEMLAAAASQQATGYEGLHGFSNIAARAPDNVEPDASSFPALHETSDDVIVGSPDNAGVDSFEASRPRKANGLWPREPLPNDSLGGSAYHALWDEFERAAVSSRSRESSYEYDLDAERYDDHMEDFTVEPKSHCEHGHEGGTRATRQPPSLAGRRSSSRVFHEVYGPATGLPGPERPDVSWRRLWSVVAKDHRFLGPQLYLAVLHLALGVGVWATGIYIESLALMCYAFIVLYDASSLFIALVPTVLEYANTRPSVEYPLGLQLLPTLLEFANNITLLYRGVQALKEGIEHIVIRGHEHSSVLEFETYSHRAAGHNHGALLGFASVVAAMMATGLSAARYANHHSMWEVRSRQRQLVATGMQNVVLNPYNVLSLFAGLWMLVMLALVPAAEESLVEPVSCVLVAAIMAYASFPTCVRLGKVLLCAVSGETADDGQKVVWQVSRLPGVVACTTYHMWCTAYDRHTMALRVSVDASANGCDSLHRRISSVLRSSGFGEWTVELRSV
ncbi:hypothetical protein H4S02_000841 [Coemansia sp. RSA 2611]|nr:hypothetical protein H4S02_000841 [Coemansia sp. RSA 2611]